MTTSLVLMRSIPAHRKLWLRGKITEQRAKVLIRSIKRLDRISSQPMLLLVNSIGGSSLWAKRIVETIEACSAPVYALVTKAYSAAFSIVQVCTRRFGRPKSRYNTHHIRFHLGFVPATAFMDTDSLKKFLDEVFEPFLRQEWLDSYLRKALLKRIHLVGKTEEQLNELMMQDRILDAKEALEWGFIDEIVRI